MQSISNKGKQILAAAAKAKSTNTTARTTATTSSSKKSSSIGTTSSSRLAASTIQGQQQLSQKYGIATFDTKGKISTVPTVDKGFSDINVGIGSFKDFNEFATAAVNKQIYDESKKRQASGVATIQSGDGFVNVTAYDDTPIYTSDPREPSRYYNPVSKDFQDTIYDPTNKMQEEKFDLGRFISENKLYIALGIAGIIFLPMILKGGRR